MKRKSPQSHSSIPSFVPPGNEASPEIRELHAFYQRQLEETKRADAERIRELQLQVRRLKSDLNHHGRILAKTGGLLHELELEREEREAREARETSGGRRKRA